MKAYAILSGGGVKGAALAGCVNAALDAGIEFVGYGGTSAGSIVALLASIGYVGDNLKSIAIDEIPFDQLLDDAGVELSRVKVQVDVLLAQRPVWNLADGIRKLLILWDLKKIAEKLGIYEGKILESFLRQKIRKILPTLSDHADVTFQHLCDKGCTPLKIVATDLRQRQPAIFREGSRWGSSVIQAVRASTTYPFVFRPVVIGDSRLVDGGLASNVPVFLFREEQQHTHFPVFAFDVAAANDIPLNGNGLNRFVRDLLTSALEASDSVLRQSLPGIVYIKVPLPDQLDALDFTVDHEKREALYFRGYAEVGRFLKDYDPLKIAHQAADVKQQLQSRYGPPTLYQPILAAVARECEEASRAKNVRVTIMLPTMHQDGSRIVVYDHNMQDDADQALILGEHAGCSGAAMQAEEGVAIADMEEARRNPENWKLTRDQAAQVPSDRRAMMSVVISSWHDVAELAHPAKLGGADRRVGVLSIDTTTALADTRWKDPLVRTEMASRLFNWTKIIARLLSA